MNQKINKEFSVVTIRKTGIAVLALFFLLAGTFSTFTVFADQNDGSSQTSVNSASTTDGVDHSNNQEDSNDNHGDTHNDQNNDHGQGGGDDNSNGHDNEKITICHATHSEKNPFVEITISQSGLNGHNGHEGDIIPASEGGCPGATVVTENVSPGISILGDNPFTLTVGNNFTDPGATAHDNEDGDLTSHIISTSTVNSAIIGSYIVTYNVTDSGGLGATSTRTVSVVATSTGGDNGGGGGGGGQTNSNGSITICKIIATTDGIIATTSSNLPTGSFSVSLSKGDSAASGTVIQTANFGSGSFSPNSHIIGATNDAQCITYGNLDISKHYYYNEESVSGSSWQSPVYNDQFTTTVHSLSDFYAYTPQLFNSDPSDDNARNLNSDGDITLSTDRPSRTLILLNTFTVSTSTPENTSPIITLLGDNPFTLTVGNNFTDPGATAHDNEDGDLTSHIVSTSTVNSAVIGSYIVTYNVTDSGGLGATSTRTVSVVATSTGGGNGGGGGGGGGSFSSGGGGTGFVSGSSQAIVGASAIGSCSPYLNDYLRIDLPNNPAEVTKLQAFLRTFESESDLAVTGVFDQTTFDAVSRFQTKYSSDILTPWGYTAPTGYVYILTKKKVNEIFCNRAFPVNGAQQSEIDAFRALLESLRKAGISVPVSGTVIPEGQNVNPGNQVGEATSTSSTSPNLLASELNIGTSTGIASIASTTNSNLRNLAAAVFALPQGLGDTLKCGLELILALAIIYLLATIVAGGVDSKRSIEEVRHRKLVTSIFGLIIGVLAGIFLQIYCIVIPLLIILIVVTAILLWRINSQEQK